MSSLGGQSETHLLNVVWEQYWANANGYYKNLLECMQNPFDTTNQLYGASLIPKPFELPSGIASCHNGT